MQRWTAARDLLLLTTVAVLPFDPPIPLLRMAGLELTLGELALLATVGCHVPIAVSRSQRALWAPGAALLYLVAKGLIAAVLAPDHEADALKATLRIGAIFALLPAAADLGHRARERLLITWTWAAVVVSVIGLVEALVPLQALESLLAVYRPKASIAFGGRRLTATFAHANLTAGYLACSLPVAAMVSSRGKRVFGLAAPAVVAVALALTLSRGGLVAGVGGLFTVALLGRTQGLSTRLPGLVAVGGILAALVMSDPLAARWGLVQLQPYAATYTVPERIEAAPAERITIPVSLTNHGAVTWRTAGTDPVGLTWHLLRADTAAIVAVHQGWTPLDADVGRGESATVKLPFSAPDKPGPYIVAIDLHHRGYADLSALGVAPGLVRLDVPSEPDASPRTGLETSHPDAVIDNAQAIAAVRKARATTGSPDHARDARRPDLWAAAVTLLAERPVRGYGLNNFRFHWGALRPELRHDERVHTNNLYLEWAVGAGVDALLAWLVFVVFAAAGIRAVLVHAKSTKSTADGSSGRDNAIVVAAAGGLVAFSLHGLVDAPLFFYANLGTFMILIGAGIARKSH